MPTVVYTVLADTESAATAARQRLCRAMDLTPLGRPSMVVGRGAAARPTPQWEQEPA